MEVEGQPHAPAASTPGKDPVPFEQETEWAPGPVWTGGKSRPHRDSIPDRPARSQALYRLRYPTHIGWKIPYIVAPCKFPQLLANNVK